MEKRVAFWGVSKNDIRRFPENARREAGYQLHRIERGEKPDDWKPMKSIGGGVEEIRIHCDGEFRVIYIAKFPEKVYVPHAFRKKEMRTPKREIDLAKARYHELISSRTRP